MSSKLNVWSIITGHLKTLKSANTQKISISDIFVFFLMPIIIAIALVFLGFKLTNDANSLLMNFGAIFTALLLSVLVLVYDQGEKLNSSNDATATIKKILLNELYDNICYSIVLSIALVFLCIATSLTISLTPSIIQNDCTYFLFTNKFILTPLIIFISINILLTILMIVKRMHALLTSNN